MGSLLRFVLSVLAASSRSSAIAAFSGRVVAVIVCASFAALLAVAAIGCVGAALWIALIPVPGPVGAPFTVSAAFLVPAGILTLFARLLMRRKRLGDTLQAELLLGETGRFFNENKGAALLAAALAGMLAGNDSRNR